MKPPRRADDNTAHGSPHASSLTPVTHTKLLKYTTAAYTNDTTTDLVARHDLTFKGKRVGCS